MTKEFDLFLTSDFKLKIYAEGVCLDIALGKDNLTDLLFERKFVKCKGKDLLR